MSDDYMILFHQFTSQELGVSSNVFSFCAYSHVCVCVCGCVYIQMLNPISQFFYSVFFFIKKKKEDMLMYLLIK